MTRQMAPTCSNIIARPVTALCGNCGMSVLFPGRLLLEQLVEELLPFVLYRLIDIFRCR
jgi:hypothetical protein